jgi:hypothetical protein
MSGEMIKVSGLQGRVNVGAAHFSDVKISQVIRQVVQ